MEMGVAPITIITATIMMVTTMVTTTGTTASSLEASRTGPDGWEFRLVTVVLVG